MLKYHKYFDCAPRIVNTNSTVNVTIKPLYDHCRLHDDQDYKIALFPVSGTFGQTEVLDAERVMVKSKGGIITAPLKFDSEQEHNLLLEDADGKLIAQFAIFALDEDLFDLRPYKGDMHMHTNNSDGVESPAYVAASCRKVGLDYIAITDHRAYEPSLEAIKSFEGVDVDLRMYPGEEVHPPGNPVHMLSFGGSFGVNEFFKTPEYEQGVAELEKELTFMPEGVDRHNYASCLWVYAKIREAGGLSLFCHPYWIFRNKYDVPEYLTNLLFEHQPFDALELISGYFIHQAESNMLQVARYYEERAKGKKIPIVGVTDSHGAEDVGLFGWYYTIVFSKSSDLRDLIDGIKGLNSVAVEALPNEQVRAFGPFRLVRYAQFLIREIFPIHDELCVEEGRLMLEHAAGNADASEELSGLKGRVKKLYDRMWGSDN
ncbi:MAG: hypothetical protein GX139_07745 [Armatimonadetes bacterium]|jgi:hypothetical protein|nr:hypothetical protein [Armatimonadota bacterium]